MLTGFQWFALISILALTFAGGYLPLFRHEEAKGGDPFPYGQAFTAGVFLALSLTMMLPSAFHLFRQAFPDLDYPIASVIAVTSFLILLSIEHYTIHLQARGGVKEGEPTPAIIPIFMTTMIAIPSFFLGTAISVSNFAAAVLIWVAIVAHKSTAGFALALKMARSTLKRRQTLVIFGLFACSTPLGIIVGQYVHQSLGGEVMVIVKGVVLAVASGLFLYMGTLHELRHTPLIEHCGNRRGFLLMVAGFVITALVRLLIGEAHKLSGNA